VRTIAFVVLGIVAFVVILVVTIPASFVAEIAGSQGSGPAAGTGGRGLQVSEAEGTVWQGRATVRASPGGAAVTDRVEWTLAPARVFAGELVFNTRHSIEGMTGTALVARTPTRMELRDVRLEGDASAFAALLPLPPAWRPGGPVSLTAPALAIEGNRLQGEMTIEWRGATSALSGVRPLGSYRAVWHGDPGGSGRVVVTTLEGPLRVNGDGATAPPTRVTFRGEARADPQAAAALAPLLDYMGPRRADGAHAIEIRID
jgi:general secretion pathway protein N